MFQFSRAIYRELAPHVLRDAGLSSQKATSRGLVLQECEAAIQRIVSDRHFSKPARTLFANVRPYFAISDLGHVFAVIERHIDLATRFVDHMPPGLRDAVGTPPQCQATTRKGTPCRRQPLRRSEYCPSHQHLTESFEDLHLEQGELELLEFGQIDLAA